MQKIYDFVRLKVVAYAILAVVAAGGLYQGNEAVNLARAVDHRGDIRACTQENLIRTQSNDRNATLERTASTVVDALNVISEANRPRDDRTNKRLRQIAAEAREIQSSFKPAALTDCEKAFPKP
jgi:hypothetical protein